MAARRLVHCELLVAAGVGVFASLDRPALRSGHPRPSGTGSAVTAAKTKKGRPKATLSRFWWRRRELNPRPPVLCLWLYMLSFR